MKRLTTYILESLDKKISEAFKSVYKTMQSLVKDNKLQPIDVNEKQLGTLPKTGVFKWEDFSQDETIKEIINDKVLGFVVTNQMMKIPKKYLVDQINGKDMEIKPECVTYIYKQDKNYYWVGICMSDPNITYMNDFVHLVGLETSLCVKESTPVLKAMLNNFIKQNGQAKGITAKPAHPKMKATLIKLGFNEFNDNKEILTYKL